MCYDEDMSESGEPFWKLFLPSWLRKGREADLTDVPLEKLQAATKRGVTIDITESTPGKVTAQVHKVIVEGHDQS